MTGRQVMLRMKFDNLLWGTPW